MFTLRRALALSAVIGAALLTMKGARGGFQEPRALSGFRRVQFDSPPIVHAFLSQVSENGVGVGTLFEDIFTHSPARWTDGKLTWTDPTIQGDASVVSDDGSWLVVVADQGPWIPFRKHGDEALEELPPLDLE